VIAEGHEHTSKSTAVTDRRYNETRPFFPFSRVSGISRFIPASPTLAFLAAWRLFRRLEAGRFIDPAGGNGVKPGFLRFLSHFWAFYPFDGHFCLV
jgi:hypothetical protein